jgi:multicomponent Na+:H+ antiporter subunit F
MVMRSQSSCARGAGRGERRGAACLLTVCTLAFSSSAVLLWTLDAVVVILGLAILLVVFRLLRGPTLPDRVVALDMIATLAAGAIAVYAVREREPVFLFVAVVLALVMFVGTVAFGFYLEKGIRRQRSEEGDEHGTGGEFPPEAPQPMSPDGPRSGSVPPPPAAPGRGGTAPPQEPMP